VAPRRSSAARSAADSASMAPRKRSRVSVMG
jgi:hypothetical protein